MRAFLSFHKMKNLNIMGSEFKNFDEKCFFCLVIKTNDNKLEYKISQRSFSDSGEGIDRIFTEVIH